ncbi:MAG TPA: glycoside hydrolase family 27 protein [Sphingobacteriaceae bacterium]
MRAITFLSIFLFLTTAQAQVNNKLAKSPPMGWNSWNYFGKENINENLIKEVIDAMAEKNLHKSGYEYIVVDGGWRDTKLGPDGQLLPNPTKFPGGMKALADYAHAKGFKFGLHTVPGSHDCGCDKVGGWGIEQVHVNQFIEWGVDFIKLDRCRFSLNEHPEGRPRKDTIWFNGWDKEGKNIEEAYTKWAKLLKDSQRNILLSASAYKFYSWYPKLTHMGRTTGDIKSIQTGGAVFESDNNRLNSVMKVADLNNKHHKYARPGYWNDPDMLVTGEQGLTIEEQKSHFALWCIMSSPLILGNDPRNMKDQELKIITNKKAIEVNQDPREQGYRIKQEDKTEVWAKKLQDGSYAVLLLNRDSAIKNIRLNFSDLKLNNKQHIKDIFEEKPLGSFNTAFTGTVPPHSSLFITVQPE